MIKFFAGKYRDIVHYAIYGSAFIVEQVVKMLKPSERPIAWKGIILSEIIASN